MKTKKLNYLSLLLFTCVSLIFTACQNDSDGAEIPQPDDIRELAIGEYTYTLGLYDITDDQIERLDDDTDNRGQLEVRMSTSNDEVIEIIDTDTEQVVYRFTYVTPSEKGFTFHINAQVIDTEYGPLTFWGHDYYQVDGNQHHGYYDHHRKELKAAMSAEIGDFTIMLTLECKKQD